MNIIFVNSTRRFGGVKAWTIDMGARLKAFGHNVHVFCRKGPFADMAHAAGLNTWAVRSFGWDYNPGAVMGFRRLFIEQGAHVVLCNVGKDLRTAGLGARLAQVPVVLRVGLPGDMKDSLKVRLTHKFIKPSVLSPCDFIARGLARELSFVDEKDIKVIRTGKEPAPEAPSTANSPRRIVTASQLNPDKGHADLLDAMKILAGQGYDFRCEMLGTGSVESELKAKAEASGLGGRVSFPGFCTDVRARMRQADIFVLPSFSEGLPNALLEALAEGLAPVSGNVGGVAEAWPPMAGDTLFDRTQGAAGMAEALAVLLKKSDQELLALRREVWEWSGLELGLDTQARKLESWLRQVAAPAGGR